jgi:hypothetical protein
MKSGNRLQSHRSSLPPLIFLRLTAYNTRKNALLSRVCDSDGERALVRIESLLIRSASLRVRPSRARRIRTDHYSSGLSVRALCSLPLAQVGDAGRLQPLSRILLLAFAESF